MNNGELLKKVNKCIAAHKAAFEKWPNGNMRSFSVDEDGIIIIRYKSGKWWHYKITESGKVEWW